MEGTSSLPGGISGVLGSKDYANLLPAWLRNQAYKELFTEEELQSHLISVNDFSPVEE